MEKDREHFGSLIAERLRRDGEQLRKAWSESHPIRHFVVDDLLDEEDARIIAEGFPSPGDMRLRSSLRERKRVSVAVDACGPLVREVQFAFQQPEVIEATRRVTGHSTLVGDPSLYAGGLSVMAEGDFLNPHIDNSHDGDIGSYRALNLLYYVSPSWTRANGGNLELWDPKVRERTTVESRFNRLVVMETNRTSWHSVSKVEVPERRLCVSNYFFSADPPGGQAYRHVTTFTGRPEEPLKRAVLAVSDRVVLNAVGRWAPSLTKRTKHRLPVKGA